MTAGPEKALAVHIVVEKEPSFETEKRMEELGALIRADGGHVVETVVQRVKVPNSSTLLGSGQVQRLNEIALDSHADVIVLNRELTPQQQKNIELGTDRKIIDRTRLIIDIFARRAHSREGKLEVEEALLRYMLPRLAGKGVEMSQIGGGVGTRRGPGETKLEMDRRRIKERLGRLKRLMDTVRKQRLVQQGRRLRTRIPLVSLVGYTSAGKSTLLNGFTRAGVQSSDELFTTLDPVSRRLHLEDGSFAVLTDTVGFIENLPVQLIKAFRTTLDDVAKSDLILLVVDVSKPDYGHDIAVVRDLLQEIGADGIPTIHVFNKADKVGDAVSLKGLTNGYERSIVVSAVNGSGMDGLERMIHTELAFIRHNRKIEDELHRAV